MKVSVLLPALAATVKLVSAHATVWAVYINDVDQGTGNSVSGYIRSPPNNNPLLDVKSPDITCNVNGRNAVARTLQVKSGDKVTFQWNHNNRDPNDDIIASTHKGPVMVYIAPTTAGTNGNNWVKLAESGYNKASDYWAVDQLIQDKGKHSVVIPNIPAGEYLLRPEIIALHEAGTVGKAQFYTACVQIRVTSAGSLALPSGISLPGSYEATDPGIKFDIYANPRNSYTPPGPRPWPATSGSSDPTPPSTPSNPPANTGEVPLYGQCGGSDYTGPTRCAPGSSCQKQNEYYSQCLPSGSQASNTGQSELYDQCGGANWKGTTTCVPGSYCRYQDQYYSQCVPNPGRMRQV